MIVHGRVQGVGFRKSTQEHARKHGITGWVQNKHDGTVEIKAEGSRDKLNSFTNRLKDGFNPFIKVKKVEINESGDDEGFENFLIK